MQALNQLGTPERAILGGAQFFKTMSNSFNYVHCPTHFSRETKSFLGEASLPPQLWTWLRAQVLCRVPYVRHGSQ